VRDGAGVVGAARVKYRKPAVRPPYYLSMYLARVSGTVVATQKLGPLAGQRLLVVRKISLDGEPLGATEDVALDPGLDAGLDDVVLVAKEGAVVATLLDGDRDGLPTPANVVIVAVVDEWSVAGEGASG